MTENKRFTIIETQIGKIIQDNESDMNTGDICIIVDLLNELHNENKELKARCEEYRKLSVQYKQKYDEKISDNTFLEKENEHLKKSVKRQQSSNNECSKLIEEQQKENQRLIKMLDNVANYMQRQNKDMPLDDFVEWWNKMATEGFE